MRGSPIVRFSVLVFALAAIAMGLMRVTSAKGTSGDFPATAAAHPAEIPPVFYRLILSAPAASVNIDTGVSQISDRESGTVELDPQNPRIALTVHWKNPTATDEHRFAKLTLEAPGQATFTHVFDAGGDIDDLVELPVNE